MLRKVCWGICQFRLEIEMNNYADYFMSYNLSIKVKVVIILGFKIKEYFVVSIYNLLENKSQ